MTTRYDVLIAGYGPVGATLANVLGRAGLRVLVLEQATDIYDKPRAIGMDHEAMRVMQACGIADQLEPTVQPFGGGKWVGMDGQTISEMDPYPRPYPLGWAPNFTFVQPQLEKMLRDRVAQRATVEVMLGCRVDDIEAHDTHVRVQATDLASGAAVNVEAVWLCACDGASSPVRARLGVPIEDQSYDEWWVVIDAFLKRPTPLPDTSVQFCDPKRPTTFIRGPQGMLRWELKILPHERPEDFKDPARILDALQPFAEPEDIDIWRSAVYRFHALVADGWRRDRVLLVGDAAHQTPPFLGQGLCSGIRDAANVAWKLVMIHQGHATPALLDSYEAERRPHVTSVIARAKTFGLLIGELDPVRAAERDARMRAELLAGQQPRLRQSLIPDLVAGLLDPNASPATGGLFVQPRVQDAQGAEGLLDACMGDGFWLVTRDAAAQQWLSEEDEAAWGRMGGERLVLLDAASDVATANACAPAPIRVLRETGGLFRSMALSSGFTAVVVRPDRYVYGSATTPEEIRVLVQGLLARLAGQPCERRPAAEVATRTRLEEAA